MEGHCVKGGLGPLAELQQAKTSLTHRQIHADRRQAADSLLVTDGLINPKGTVAVAPNEDDKYSADRYISSARWTE
jgi:hypothetical protein